MNVNKVKTMTNNNEPRTMNCSKQSQSKPISRNMSFPRLVLRSEEQLRRVVKRESTVSLFFWIPVFTGMTIVCAFASAHARVLPEAAKLVPPETVLLINIDNFSRLKQQFEKTNIYKLYKAPAMAAFVDDFKAKLRKEIRGADNDIVEAIINTDVLPQGRVAIALVLNKRAIDKNEPMALFITQWGQNIPKIKEAVDKTIEKAIADGSGQKTEDYRGVEIKTIIAEKSSRLRYGFSSTLSYCFIDDCLLGSEDIDVLKFVIAHIKNAGSPTLADDADYVATMKAAGPYHDINFYVNIKQIIKTILDQDASGNDRTMMANLGFDNVAAFGCSMGLAGSPDSSCCGKAFLKINGAKKGVCKMLDIESAFLKVPRFIPESVYSAVFLNLNIKKAYNELGNILNSFSPQAAAWMYMPLPTSDSPDEPGLKIKDDIIDYLDSQIIIAQSTNKPFSTNSTPTESLVCLAVNNRSALEKSLSLLHSKMIAPGNPDASRELLGYTIYRIDLPALPFFPSGVTPMQNQPPQSAPAPRLAFTITDTHWIFSTEAAVEQVIRILNSHSAKSIASTEWFGKTKSAIPSVVGLAALEDNAASGEMFWWLLKQKKKIAASDPIPSGSVDFEDLLDFGLLPEFEVVRKYFGLSAFYGISKSDGFFFEFKNLN